VTPQGITLAILGAGGHGMVVAEAAALCARWTDIHFYDDALGAVPQIAAWPVVGKISHLLEQLKLTGPRPIEVMVAIGHNAARASAMEHLAEHGARFATVVHPRAYLSPSATIGAGSVALAGSVVNSRSHLGEGCIVNVGTVVDHDVKIGSFAHLGPGCVIAGGCQVGRMAWLCTASRMAPGQSVAENVILAPGTVLA
jgi:sugar O-acyltransferase (sialic acid O-acetyltransferase NeuD family)